MTRRLDIRRDEGFALVLVMLLIAILTILGITLMELVRSESTRSAKAVTSGTSYQAAEAGIDDYIAKLVDDRLYFDHYVHDGESTRTATSGTTTGAGQKWTGGGGWQYLNGKDTWTENTLGNGYEYNLQVFAPTASVPHIKIVSTGRKKGSTTDQRSIEALVRPSSIADFVMMANSDVSYGSTATTKGKVYAGIDSSGVKHNVYHPGTAYADIYAEGNVTGSPTLIGDAGKYDQTTIRTKIKQPIDFNNFVVALVDVESASDPALGGIKLDDATKDAWEILFVNDGTVRYRWCKKNGSNDVAYDKPTNCGSWTTKPVPSNGAIYSAQTAIVSGEVNGRVTVASNNHIVVGEETKYYQEGDDVLGLIAKNDVIVAQWAPSVFNWRAAVLAQTGRRHSYSSDGSHAKAVFKGSTATNLSPYMDMFVEREYIYDEQLLYLQPPWFPTIEGAYTVVLFREVTP